ncbi:MAG: bifunctional phosphoribosylaminoimidazolecarboxamide formyltransferase/IMP cyclohydrolase [Candidatus Thermoplasmatota archaeon]
MFRLSRKALISVNEKSGVVSFAEGLIENGFDIVSSGGTAAVLEENGLKVQRVSEITGFPEILDGRVKTLHPKIHGGILYQTGKHEEDIEEHALPQLDVVVVNLYPFENVIQGEHDLEEAIENIDIGGVALLRAAAKNHERVTVVTEKEDYDLVLKELETNDGEISEEVRKDLALKAFQRTARYDAVISDYLQSEFKTEKFAENNHVFGEKVKDLRYGENPNQDAAFYRTERTQESSVLKAEKLHGKALSYNNIRDIEAAMDMVKEFEKPAVAAIKHTNPTGVATKEDLAEAYQLAYECDPQSIYGSIIGANRPITVEMAEKMDEIFVEASIAPGYEEGAIDVLKNSKNIRIMELPEWNPEREGFEFAKIAEGLLVQDRNKNKVKKEDMEVKSEREPTDEELDAMEFAWKVIKHVKSNSIIFTREDHTVGIGAGQMSRVDAVKIAKMKSRSDTQGCTMASDAFFPFRDGIDEAAEAGIESVIQPGGSIRDDEVIEAVDEHGMSMVFTGQRVFKH